MAGTRLRTVGWPNLHGAVVCKWTQLSIPGLSHEFRICSWFYCLDIRSLNRLLIVGQRFFTHHHEPEGRRKAS